MISSGCSASARLAIKGVLKDIMLYAVDKCKKTISVKGVAVTSLYLPS